jgi:hypothetical protein
MFSSMKALSVRSLRVLFLGPEPLHKTSIPFAAKGQEVVPKLRTVRG